MRRKNKNTYYFLLVFLDLTLRITLGERPWEASKKGRGCEVESGICKADTEGRAMPWRPGSTEEDEAIGIGAIASGRIGVAPEGNEERKGVSMALLAGKTTGVIDPARCRL
jgi:hypothetical protein